MRKCLAVMPQSHNFRLSNKLRENFQYSDENHAAGMSVLTGERRNFVAELRCVHFVYMKQNSFRRNLKVYEEVKSNDKEDWVLKNIKYCRVRDAVKICER